MILGYNTQTQSSDEYGVFPSVYLLISLEPTLNQSRLLKKKVIHSYLSNSCEHADSSHTCTNMHTKFHDKSNFRHTWFKAQLETCLPHDFQKLKIDFKKIVCIPV